MLEAHKHLTWLALRFVPHALVALKVCTHNAPRHVVYSVHISNLRSGTGPLCDPLIKHVAAQLCTNGYVILLKLEYEFGKYCVHTQLLCSTCLW
jgi:hypothetical protein